MSQPTRLAWVDTGRGIAITLVVLFHTRNWIAGTGVDVGFWTDLNTVLSSMRMPFFFVLSGLFAAKWLTASWGSLLRTKVLLFGWVLVVWSVIGIIVQVTGLYVAGKPVGITSAIRDLVLTPILPLYELWFVWALGLFFVLAKLLRGVPALAQLIVAGLISAVGLTLWSTLTTGLTGSAKFFFFFLCGLYLRRFILAVAETSPWLRVGVLLAWATMSSLLYVLDLRSLPGVYFLNCAIGVLAGIALSTFVVGFRLLGRLGQQTLPIYLAHTPIVVIISILLLLVPPLLAGAAYLGPMIVPLVAVVAIAGALGLHRAASRSSMRLLYEPPPRLVRAFGGGR